MELEEMKKRLKIVQEMKLPRMNYLKLKEMVQLNEFEETEENIKIMDNYLNNFLDPNNESEFQNGCWLCGNVDVILRWGIAHGELIANCCGLCYRGCHYLSDINKSFNGRLDLCLQYHPDDYNFDTE